jgi:hypothetical protein
VDDFVWNTSDFPFTCVVYDGIDLRVSDWDALWTRRCETSMSRIKWQHAYSCGASAYSCGASYTPGFFDCPTAHSLHTDATMLVRTHGRRAKWELRAGMQINILDEMEIIDALDAPPLPWPVTREEENMHQSVYGSPQPKFYLSSSPWTGSLYLTPTPYLLPWASLPSCRQHCQRPAGLYVVTLADVRLVAQQRSTLASLDWAHWANEDDHGWGEGHDDFPASSSASRVRTAFSSKVAKPALRHRRRRRREHQKHVAPKAGRSHPSSSSSSTCSASAAAPTVGETRRQQRRCADRDRCNARTVKSFGVEENAKALGSATRQ